MAGNDTAREVEIDAGTGFCPSGFVRLAAAGTPVRISPASRALVADARNTVDACLELGAPVYGLNTGLGALVDKRLDHATL